MTLYCAACMNAKRQTVILGDIGTADTMIEGTALCLEHARFWMDTSVRVQGVKA